MAGWNLDGTTSTGATPSGGYNNPSLIFGGSAPSSGYVLPNLNPGANLGGVPSAAGASAGGSNPAMASVNYSQPAGAIPQKIWTADNLPTTGGTPPQTPGQQTVADAITGGNAAAGVPPGAVSVPQGSRVGVGAGGLMSPNVGANAPDMPYYTMATDTTTGQRYAVPATQAQFNQYQQNWQNMAGGGGGGGMGYANYGGVSPGMARAAMMANPVFQNRNQVLAGLPAATRTSMGLPASAT